MDKSVIYIYMYIYNSYIYIASSALMFFYFVRSCEIKYNEIFMKVSVLVLTLFLL